MPFQVAEELVHAAGDALGGPSRTSTPACLLRDNGGKLRVDDCTGDDPRWTLHPVRNDSDRKRLARTMADVKETEAARELPGFPDGAVSVAENGTGDRVVLADGGGYAWWDHETGETAAVTVLWDD